MRERRWRGTDDRARRAMVHSSIRRHLPPLLALAALFTWLFARFFFRPLYIAESDLYENGLPIFLSPIWKWSSFEFSGLPVLADPANFDFYLPNVVFGELLRSWTAVVMSGALLAACFTYAYVFGMTRSRTAAVFSALAFGLSEDMLERLRHINHVHAVAWLPLIVLALDRVRAAAGSSADAPGATAGRWIAIGAFAVGSCILAGHPQPALYVMYCAGLYALVGIGAEARVLEAGSFRTRQICKHVASTAAMFAIGILLSSVKAFPLIEARNIVARSEGLTFQRFVGPSLSAPQLFSFVFPTVVHGPATELPTYVGLATLLLAIVGATRLRSNWRVGFWLVMSVAGIVLALGTATPLVTAAYYVPLYSWFRNISRHMFLFAFGASVLAGAGVAAFERREVSPRALRTSAGVLIIVMVTGALLIRALPASFPLEAPHGEPGPGPLSIFTIGVWIQFAILAAVLAVAGTWGRRSLSGDRRAWLVDRLSRLATMGANGEVRPSVLADDDVTLDLLAVKYVIVNADQLTEPERQRWLRGSDRWSEAMHFRTARDTDRGKDEDVAGETDVTVFENRRALPRAWLSGSVTPMADAAAIATVKSSRLPDGGRFDPRASALVDPASVPPVSRVRPGASDVRVTRIGDGDIGIRVASEGGGFLVLSENAYPGWRARVDGADAPIYRADVTLQGVIVPPGAHRVAFTMESQT